MERNHRGRIIHEIVKPVDTADHSCQILVGLIRPRPTFPVVL